MKCALAIAAVVTLATATTAASAVSKHHKRYAHPRPGPAAVAPAPPPSFAPARMIEVRPGVWISSYGCIQDEGYGRWTYCGQGRGE